ncbi:GntR family transcriptional regulator [Dactylosporangium matsuzakiense]|uniref:HTH-type transcriptional repressor DasR n=1 Tax=Dactylosporangium matsuzakiense TaxID=53360 RepID=A0A9W6KHW5_9ACTN|nr:GntR family transcriptional regulator [Dactylosporangium matsuzakiense]UWZ48955.1 GntR family transcriptional regulator [Dactylosporangium matsuzakiense]GLL00814.1 HTH-type transcriptional repressor DasR [Dactylosporangium matsuzakiense]
MTKAPLYVRIERELRARLAQARPGDAVPAESALAAEFGVARMTVRAALNALETDGLIERVQGRGTFVRQRPEPRAAGTLMSFQDQVRAWGRTPTSRLLAGEVRAASGAEAAALDLSAAAPQVVSIVRVRLADDVPVAIEYACFPAHLSALLDIDLEVASLHRALHERGLRPTLGTSTLTAHRAGADGEHLHVPADEPLLVEARLIVDQHSAPLEYTISRYVGGRYDLHVTFDVQPPRTGAAR